MLRRLAVTATAFVVAGVTVGQPGASVGAAGQSIEPERPNVLVIVTDDQRARGTLRAMPASKKLFKSRGTTYTRAFATTPTCCPSRASILTGQYAHNHGVRTSEAGQAEVLDQSTTLQRHLGDAGYRTAIFGKFLNRWPDHEPPPYLDDWAILVDRIKRGYRNGLWNVNGSVTRIAQYSTDFLSDQAVQFVRAAESDDDRPWFLYLAPIAPHIPPQPEATYEAVPTGKFKATPAMFEEDRSDKPPYVLEYEVTRKEVRDTSKAQLRTLMSVDDLVKRLFRVLDARGETRDTLAFFLSDNGYLWGEHGSMGKRFPYIYSVKIPLMVRWPGRVARGAKDDRLVANIDLAPTIYDVTGITPGHVMDGRSLFDLTQVRDRLLLEHWDRANRTTPDWAALLAADRQYAEHYLADRFVVTFREYYDLLSDRWQLTNLLGDRDVRNDPDFTVDSVTLTRDIRCRGTLGPEGCP